MMGALRVLLVAGVLACLAAPVAADAAVRLTVTPESTSIARGERLVVVVRLRDTGDLVVGDVVVRLRRSGAPTLSRRVLAAPDGNRWTHRIGIRIPRDAPIGRYRLSAEVFDDGAVPSLASFRGPLVRVRVR